MTDAAVMTREETLTEADYVQRLTQLKSLLRKATEDHEHASYRVEIQQMDAAELGATRDTVLALTDRIAGLERGWEDANRQRLAERNERETSRRREAAETVEIHLQTMLAAATAFESLESDIAEIVTSYTRAFGAIMATAKPFPDIDRREIREAMNPNGGGMFHFFVAGLLHRAGLTGLSGFDHQVAQFALQDRGGLAAWVAQTGNGVRAQIAALSDNDGDE